MIVVAGESRRHRARACVVAAQNQNAVVDDGEVVVAEHLRVLRVQAAADRDNADGDAAFNRPRRVVYRARKADAQRRRVGKRDCHRRRGDLRKAV